MEEVYEKLTIRGIAVEPYYRARKAALREKKTIGKWMNEAIKSKLKGGK